MDEVFLSALKDLGGEGGSFVELRKLTLDSKVRSFFRTKLFKPPWDDATFAIFFQSRPDEWEYDERTQSVRVFSSVTKQIQEATAARRKAAPFPEALFTSILKAGTPQETAFVISSADNSHIAALPVDAHEALFESLNKQPECPDPLVAVGVLATHVSAQVKMLVALQGALERKGAPLGQVLDFYSKVVKFGGEEVDPRTAQQKLLTLKGLCEHVANMLRKSGLGAVTPKAAMLFCSTAPFHIVALAISCMGDKGEGLDVKACAALLGNMPPQILEGLPCETLINLAVAATKSKAVAEETVNLVAKACAGTLPTWSMDDIAKLLLATSKAKAGTDSAGVTELYGRACEALSPKVAEMSVTHIIKVAVVLGKVTTCRDFLDMLAVEATNKLTGMAPPLLLMLTQGLMPLGGGHASIIKILDSWVASFNDGKVQLTADQLGKLAQTVATPGPSTLAANVAGSGPSSEAFWKALGPKLVAEQKSFTDAGWASVDAAFSGTAAAEIPSFDGKEKLWATLAQRKKPKEEEKPKGRAETKDERRRSRSRGGDRGGKDAQKDDRRGDDRGGRGDRRDDRRDGRSDRRDQVDDRDRRRR